MKRRKKEAPRPDKLRLLHSVVKTIFDLDEPLRQLSFALLSLSESAAQGRPGSVLVQSISLHSEDFEGVLPANQSVTQIMRRFQLHDPQITYPRTMKGKSIESEAPLFEIVSSLELTGVNPQIVWWVRPGQWSQWGLSTADRLLLCRFARTALKERDAKYHRLLALLTLTVALRVDVEAPKMTGSLGRMKSNQGAGEGGDEIEVSVKSIRDDLASIEEMFNFLPKEADLGQQTAVVIDDFVDSNLFQYTDESHEAINILSLAQTMKGYATSPDT